MVAKKSKSVLLANQDKNEDPGNEFYAFVDSIETLENGRTIIQFDSIERNQIEQFNKNELTPADIESLKPTMIRCDFSTSVYEIFKNENNEFEEGIWLDLRISQKPSQFQAEYIPEYFEGNPEVSSAFINQSSKVVPSNKQKLEAFFEIKNNEDALLRLIRLKKINQICKVEPKLDNSEFDIVSYSVGQGNMSAILDKSGIPLAYYDVGGGSYWNAHTYTPPNPRQLCFKNKPIFVLSHWDSDHWWTFNGLLRNRKINKYQVPQTTWIVPSQKVGPIQYKFYNLLVANNHRIISLATIATHNLGFGEVVKCKGNTMNDGGLAVKVKIGSLCFLLPGDASYDN